MALSPRSRPRRGTWRVSKPQTRNQFIEPRVATHRIEFRVKSEKCRKGHSLAQTPDDRLDCLINVTQCYVHSCERAYRDIAGLCDPRKRRDNLKRLLAPVQVDQASAQHRQTQRVRRVGLAALHQLWSGGEATLAHIEIRERIVRFCGLAIQN